MSFFVGLPFWGAKFTITASTASAEVKKDGYRLINRMKKELKPDIQAQLSKFFADIDKGVRDEYV